MRIAHQKYISSGIGQIKNLNIQTDGCTGTYLDTLAQLTYGKEKTPKLDGKEVFSKRARSKWYTQKIVAPLLKLDTPLLKQYKRAYYECCSILKQKGRGNMTSTFYCNSRVCNVCNRIRTAKLMNGYMAQLGDIEKLYFGTLTAPNVPGHLLKSEIKRYIKDFRYIINKMLRQLHGRKGGVKWQGIRKIECTYNEEENTYHPHIHFIGGENSDLIIQCWLKLRQDALPVGQHLQQANKGSLNELFKYSTKLITKSDTEKGTLKVNPVALDTIMQALNRKRTFQPYGIIKQVSEEVGEEEQQEYKNLPDHSNMTWIWNEHDWFNIYNEPLTNYTPPNILFEVTPGNTSPP